MKLIAQIAYRTVPLKLDLTSPNPQEEELEKWGNSIIHELKKQGYYINKVKGDPSGRW